MRLHPSLLLMGERSLIDDSLTDATELNHSANQIHLLEFLPLDPE